MTNSLDGIVVLPIGTGTVNASLSRVEFYNASSSGFVVVGDSSTGTITTVVADTVAVHNQTGFRLSTSSASSRMMVIRSVASNNSIGLYAWGAAATLRVGQSTLTGNTTTWTTVNSAVLRSYQDNNIDGNADGDPAPTTIAKK